MQLRFGWVRPNAGALHRVAARVPRQLPELEYPGQFLVTRVTHAGTIRFKHTPLFFANAMKQHHVG